MLTADTVVTPIGNRLATYAVSYLDYRTARLYDRVSDAADLSDCNQIQPWCSHDEPAGCNCFFCNSGEQRLDY